MRCVLGVLVVLASLVLVCCDAQATPTSFMRYVPDFADKCGWSPGGLPPGCNYYLIDEIDGDTTHDKIYVRSETVKVDQHVMRKYSGSIEGGHYPNITVGKLRVRYAGFPARYGAGDIDLSFYKGGHVFASWALFTPWDTVWSTITTSEKHAQWSALDLDGPIIVLGGACSDDRQTLLLDEARMHIWYEP